MSPDLKDQTISLEVPENATVSLPVEISSPQAVRGAFGKNSNSTVVFNYLQAEQKAGENAAYEFFLGEGSALEVFYVEPSFNGVSRFYLEKDSALRIFFFSRDHAEVENRVLVQFKGENTRASAAGLSILSGAAKAAYDITMDHEHGQSKSEQFFKSVLAGRSRSEFRSLVSVHPGAQRSDSRQLNKNLLLSDLAEAYSRPELRILADDVSCSHGSASGQIEDSELFYLQSRGISKVQARYLLVYGFAKEAMEGIRDQKLKAMLEAKITEKLGEVVPST